VRAKRYPKSLFRAIIAVCRAEQSLLKHPQKKAATSGSSGYVCATSADMLIPAKGGNGAASNLQPPPPMMMKMMMMKLVADPVFLGCSPQETRPRLSPQRPANVPLTTYCTCVL